MTDNSSYQTPHGYYYQPYNDDGPYQKRLEHEGEVIGSAIFGVGGAEFGRGGAVIGALIGDFVGGMAGKAAGFYVDNLSAISKNMDTLMRELNDYRTWTGGLDHAF